jgi:hypothetical protein
VDFSSGINLFPDLRLVNNDSIEYYRSLKAIESVIEKMAVLGASDLILSAHRTIENNFSRDKFNESLQNTIREICRYSAKYKINVNMRMASGRSPVNLQQAIEFVKSVNEPNFYISPASALLMDNRDDFNKNIELLKGLKFRIFLVAAPERDIYGTLWNINLPINKYNDIGKLIQLISSNTECSLVLDGIYSGQDEEYLDIKAIEGMN